MSFSDLVEIVLETHPALPDQFDHGRMPPRPHEHALWEQNEATRAMCKLLMGGQSSLPFDQIVNLADNPIDNPPGRPLQVFASVLKSSYV